MTEVLAWCTENWDLITAVVAIIGLVVKGGWTKSTLSQALNVLSGVIELEEGKQGKVKAGVRAVMGKAPKSVQAAIINSVNTVDPKKATPKTILKKVFGGILKRRLGL